MFVCLHKITFYKMPCFYSVLNVNTIYRSIFLGLIALFGDRMVHINEDHDFMKAVSDNCTHAMIGAVTWAIVIHNSRPLLSSITVAVEIILCAAISSGIDLDHFIAARSIHLRNATNLEHRPVLHCTTVPLAAFLVLVLVAYMIQSLFLERFAWVCLAAFLSHHVRDAARRGFWVWPLGSSPPTGTVIYLVLTIILPGFLCATMNYFKVINLTSRGYSDVSIV